MRHVPNQNGGKIIWDSEDFKAGLGPQGTFGNSLNLKQTESFGWSFLQKIDPFRRYGILTPSAAPSVAYTNNSNLGGNIVALQLANDNVNAYIIDAGGKINSINYSTGLISVTSPFNPTGKLIAGTSPVGQDLLIYTHNSGGSPVASMFYTYYNNANWDVGAFVNLTTFDDDFMSSILPATPLDITTGDGDDVNQRTAPHTMCIGADGILYIGSGRYVHAYDGATGTNGTFSSKVLTLPQGFQIIGIVKNGSLLLISGNYFSIPGSSNPGGGQAQLYTWNYIDLDITEVISLEDPYVGSLFMWRGVPTVITFGIAERNGEIKVKIVTGNSVTKIADFAGTVPIHRGVYVANDIFYINSGGKIISVGDKFNKNSNVVNHIGTFRNASLSGIINYSFITSVLMGGSSDGTHSFNTMNGFAYDGQAIATSFYFQPDLPIGKTARVKSVQVEYYAATAFHAQNGNLTINLRTDFSATSTRVVYLLTDVDKAIKRYTNASNGVPFPIFSALGIQIIYEATTGASGDVPLVASMTAEYELLEIAG